MSHGLLDILRYFLLALIWLFFIYAARMVLVEVRRGRGEVHAAASEGTPLASPSARERRSRTLRLRILEPRERRGELFELGEEVTLGRSPGCVIALSDDTFASSVHARVFAQEGEFWLEDLGSTNGTTYNGKRLDGPAQLRRGDRVRVGRTLLEVVR